MTERQKVPSSNTLLTHKYSQKKGRLLPHRLARLAHNLHQLRISLCKLIIAFTRLLSHLLLANHDDARRTLSRARLAELRTALDVDVRHIVVFAEDRDMRNDVHGGDVSGDDNDRRGVGERGCGACGRRLAQSFDDFFYTAAESLGFGG